MNKKVKKVVIPAAGWGTRFLPLTKVVHKELVPVLNKPIIHYLTKEAVDAGIEELILVISPRKLDILKYFTVNEPLERVLREKGKVELLKKVEETNKIIKVTIATQDEQLGLGHAIFSAAEMVGDEPFAVILGDDLIKSKVPAIKQLIEAYDKTQSSIVGVQSVKEEDINKYGIVEPKVASDKNKKLFKLKDAIEKPSPKYAPSNKAILGRYIFTPQLMPLLKELKPGAGNEINVVDAFQELLKTQDIYAFEFEGMRYDLGSMVGFVKANIDYALDDETINYDILDFIKSKI